MNISSNQGENFWVKIHEIENYTIIAICDEDLLGKELHDAKLGISIKIDPLFYGGEILGFDEIIPLLNRANVINAIGNNIVKRLSEAGYINSESDAIEINGIKHVQIYVLYSD